MDVHHQSGEREKVRKNDFLIGKNGSVNIKN